MYAIVKTGGKQYKVEQGTIFSTELLDAQVGSVIELNALLFADDDKVIAGEGTNNVKVMAEVVEHGKGKKLTIFTYKAKKNVRHKQGHRQPYTKLKVTSITAK
ncbi:MAG: 50S ribosomal protein L21 [Clostridia bacterium]|nr:50S ribosomal protein L21 [Clostridia bacterium]